MGPENSRFVLNTLLQPFCLLTKEVLEVGEETYQYIEYIKGTCFLSRGRALSRLSAEEEVNALVKTTNRCLWRPEFGISYMIEALPALTARVDFVDFLPIIRSIGLHIAVFQTKSGEQRVGWKHFLARAGCLFRSPKIQKLDEKHPRPSREQDFISVRKELQGLTRQSPNRITFTWTHRGDLPSCRSVNEARWLYDQLTQSLRSCWLFCRDADFPSKLSDVDSRWTSSVQVSTTELQKNGTGSLKTQMDNLKRVQFRYDSTDCYIYPCSVGYNDIPLQYDEGLYKQMLDGGIDRPTHENHIAHAHVHP
ncbi:unnamed protein product [Caenorhabditis auriculariae]|uniref:Glutamate--cysteine ligase n=1 Tax=Caenorhabditis auriculariae TaxID=2777116 RepID=A0A8S1HFK5_9PELO|nr:unnamed protein product [Caenorhabditis auriculariae]